ncbi:cytochrome C554 and C-prime [Leptospira kanakyensis]|uniref:Cytochrome C554 and C-prime n=1 Tax=Leptospira kanakyensis TaxID=2484968 RepID=A0A6N4QNQ2_9LEPT|nr:multiheme c-type cytochrome [Leptospira kanakyensis]TGK55308.1 cytochrome C554 and C-prime [Leptospira kanakyensis]TGK60842.1 cytochrome C554 and C-prime [Leptospira kanakyensis]TGK76683.1 cytochrome C554 and C-prime [Leptospira kanakyensis]
MKRNLFILLLVLIVFSIGGFLYLNQREVPIEQVFPGKIWAKPIENLPDLKGVGATTAKNCGNCHTEIYEEWQRSTHANALTDIQFQSELAKPSSPKWICLNCHIPVQNQRETIITGLRNGDYFRPVEIPNPNFNPDMKEEGVTCATCHVRVDSQTKESYVIGGTGGTSPPHPIKIDRKQLLNRCYDCHNETYTLNESLVCSFQTGTELQATHSSQTCSSCHQPEVRRSFVKTSLNKPIRTSHKHGFIGGGVPKRFDLYPDQIRLGYKPGIVLSRLKVENETIEIEIKNKNADHHVTTGDPERFYRLSLVGLDFKGNSIFQTETTIGQEWSWSPQAKKVNDTRIPSGKVYVWKLKQTDLPVVSYLFQATHVRLKNVTSDYMSLSSGYLTSPYKEKVEKIKELYPHSSLVIESLYHVNTKSRKDTPLEDLFKRNAERKGE